VSRFLRLMPTYWLVLLVSGTLLGTFKAIWLRLGPAAIWTKAWVLLSNLMIFGTDWLWFISLDPSTGKVTLDPYNPTLEGSTHNGYGLLANPPIFTVSLEMWFYLLAPFVVTSLWRSLVFFCTGLVYHVGVVMFHEKTLALQYHLFPSSFVFFAAGGIAYHLSRRKRAISHPEYVTAFTLGTAFLLITIQGENLLVLAFLFAVPLLFDLTKRIKLDRVLGELSYPIYLVHYPILQFVRTLHLDTRQVGITVTVMSIAASLLIYFFFERYIEDYRQRLTQRILESQPPRHTNTAPETAPVYGNLGRDARIHANGGRHVSK
jgi:peptidoglycan/LPS O-acetylase OafA/YrhL